MVEAYTVVIFLDANLTLFMKKLEKVILLAIETPILELESYISSLVHKTMLFSWYMGRVV